MSNLLISIFGNKVLLEVLKELDFFPNAEIKLYENFQQNTSNKIFEEQIIILFYDEERIDEYFKMKEANLPILVISKSSKPIQKLESFFTDQIIAPFKISNLKSKILTALTKYKYKKTSLIKLGDYKINKNERKISKGNLELKLTEKEINFLILFTLQNKPINKNFILQNLWNYSPESDTHTVETHIHRLRKKIFEKFNDSKFIKNNKKGYYI